MNTVSVKSYSPPPVNKKELLRYMGVKQTDERLDEFICECIKEAEEKLTYKICYSCFDIKKDGSLIDLGFARVRSKSLEKNLENADGIILFAATVGIELDRLILKYSRLSPVKALILDALGIERIEALCDTFESEIKEKYKVCAPRFSAGYGDFDIAFQKDIFRALDCPKSIGVSLGKSLLASPSKSVTAIIGVTK